MARASVMQQVMLKGKTRHGKNRIHQHGDQWFIVKFDKFRGQDAMMLRSENKTDKGTFDGRWVLLQDDPNFVMINNFDEDKQDGKDNQ